MPPRKRDFSLEMASYCERAMPANPGRRTTRKVRTRKQGFTPYGLLSLSLKLSEKAAAAIRHAAGV